MFKKRTVDMTEGPITKNLLIFSIPLILSSILQLLYNAADIAIVGRFAGLCGFRILWIFTVFRKFHTYSMLYLCYPPSWMLVITANIIAIAIIYKKKLKPHNT